MRRSNPDNPSVDIANFRGIFHTMSVQEIQSQLVKLKPDELANVARFLETLRETQSPAFAQELGQRHREMDSGRKISEAELARLLAAKPSVPQP